jgi:hypothetical protein
LLPPAPNIDEGIMKNVLALMSVACLAACGGGGGGSSPTAPAPQNVTVPPLSASSPPTLTADLSLADRLYKGDARTPAGFDVEARPANVAGTLSTRHLRNTDFATGPQAAGPTFEVCTDDMAQAIDWSESLATWNGQYSDLSEVRGDAQKFEVIRVPRADVTAMLRHRVFKCAYLDRAGSDLRSDTGAAGALNQRPLDATELEALSEYLWQFTLFNNSDYAVESSSRSTNGSQLVHAIRMGQLVLGVSGGCDTVHLLDWTHTVNTGDGALTRSLTPVRNFQVKNSASGVETCGS